MERIGEHLNKYWEDYYKNNNPPTYPSDFAKFICNNFDISKLDIVDICCGNGRDTYYISNYCRSITGVDNAFKPKNFGKAKFVKSKVENFVKNDQIIYCRFGFHSFSKEVEDIILTKSSQIFLEFRSDKDKPYENHYRRLINGTKFIAKLLSLGFEINYFQENNNLAVLNSENPVIIRVVAKNEI